MPLIDFTSLPEGCDAWLFPGQGAQQIGMSLDFASEDADIAAMFAEADEILGTPLRNLIASGPEEELAKTVNTQPAVFVASLTALKAATKRNEFLGLSRPRFVAGHSLGEYSAVVASGSLSFADGLRLVQERARLMQEVSEERPGTMAALLGASLRQARALCDATGCEVCNINSLGQIVIGGTVEAMAAAAQAAREHGIPRVIPLKVGGAFHTSLMSPAADGLSAYLAGIVLSDPEIPVVANGSAEPLATAQALRDELTFQLDHTVLWEDSIRRMVEGGVNHFIEFGPGSILTGMVKRIAPEVGTSNFSIFANLASPVAS